MNGDKLKKLILSLTQDIEFIYNGVHGAICPFNHNKISVAFGDVEVEYDNINDVMNSTVFEGKSLRDIATELEIQ